MSELAPDELVGRGELAARERWPDARILDLEPLQGGISSLTFSAALEGAGADTVTGASDARRVVFKVAPPGLAPVRNRDVIRQARVIRALHGAQGVRVPEVLFEDDGSPPFFVMQFVDGQAYEPKWDLSASPPSAQVVSARARAAATMLAHLHRITPEAVGLGAEPVLSLADELERWSTLFATAGDDLRGDELSLKQALARRTPSELPARILHGDYRLGNMQFSGGQLAAIIDWELWSLGDPRNDLAWLLTFADPVQQRVSERDPANQAAAGAMPGPEELLAVYLATAGDDAPADLNWFIALSSYKLGATMSVLAKRNRRQPEPDPGLELVAQTTPPMIEHALALIG